MIQLKYVNYSNGFGLFFRSVFFIPVINSSKKINNNAKINIQRVGK